MTVVDFPAKRAPEPTRKKFRARTTATEDQIQSALNRHLAVRLRSDVVWFHVPNGGYRNAIEAARFKGMGVKAGVPDCLFFDRGRFYGLELKTEERVTQPSAISPAQREMLAALTRAGGTVAVAYGIDHALMVIGGWGLLKPSVRTELHRRDRMLLDPDEEG